MSRRARNRAAATQAKRINLIPQRRHDEDSFDRAMDAAQNQLRAQEAAAARNANGSAR